VINNAHMEVKNSRSGNNECHVLLEDVCKVRVALYPNFTDEFSKKGFVRRVA